MARPLIAARARRPVAGLTCAAASAGSPDAIVEFLSRREHLEICRQLQLIALEVVKAVSQIFLTREVGKLVSLHSCWPVQLSRSYGRANRDKRSAARSTFRRLLPSKR